MEKKINFPPFELEPTIFASQDYPKGLRVGESVFKNDKSFSEKIKSILDVTDEDKYNNDTQVPMWTHVDYRLWLLNLFQNVKDNSGKTPAYNENRTRNYLASNINIMNPPLWNFPIQAFKDFYDNNEVYINNKKNELDVEKVKLERKCEAKRWKKIQLIRQQKSWNFFKIKKQEAALLKMEKKQLLKQKQEEDRNATKEENPGETKTPRSIPIEFEKKKRAEKIKRAEEMAQLEQEINHLTNETNKYEQKKHAVEQTIAKLKKEAEAKLKKEAEEAAEKLDANKNNGVKKSKTKKTKKRKKRKKTRKNNQNKEENKEKATNKKTRKNNQKNQNKTRKIYRSAEMKPFLSSSPLYPHQSQLFIECWRDNNGKIKCKKPAKLLQKDGKTIITFEPTPPPNKDNPFKKIPHKNWLQENIFNNNEYKKYKEKFNIYLKYLENKDFFKIDYTDAPAVGTWCEKNISKYNSDINPVTQKEFRKHMNIYKYKCILLTNIHQLTVDSTRCGPWGKYRKPSDTILNNIFKLGFEGINPNTNNNSIASIFCILHIILSLEMSEHGYFYCQGDDSIFSHILLFTNSIVNEYSLLNNVDKSEEFVYIMYFLLRKIFYASYSLKKPKYNKKIIEDYDKGLSIHSIFQNNSDHITNNPVAERAGLKYENSTLFNRLSQKVILYIFLSIILKKHRDIFSNLWLSHKNVINQMFKSLYTSPLGTFFWTSGPAWHADKYGGDLLNPNATPANIRHRGFFSTVDFTIVKNIYANFLLNNNLLEFITSLCVAYTSRVPDDSYYFNNIPWSKDTQLALKENSFPGGWTDLPVDDKNFRYNNSFWWQNTIQPVLGMVGWTLLTMSDNGALDIECMDPEIEKKWNNNGGSKGVNILGLHDNELWSYNEDSIKDYDIILQFFNSDLFNRLLSYFSDEIPKWNCNPECPTWFILDDDSMWGTSFSKHWVKSKILQTDKESGCLGCCSRVKKKTRQNMSGGKLSIGRLAGKRLEYIQKLIKKKTLKKSNRRFKKYNRRLNKTIKLY